MRFFSEITKGLIKENPMFVLVLGTCPTLAVSTSVINALGMGAAATFVLICSSALISLLRKVIPDKVRIPAYIVVIATFVTIVDLFMNAYLPDLHQVLGLFIPLIVVNCIVLGRAEAFASKNSLISSILDGLGMGLGFTWALTVLGAVRELLGSGSLFGYQLAADGATTIGIMSLPPGAFITLGILMAFMNMIAARQKKRATKEVRP